MAVPSAVATLYLANGASPGALEGVLPLVSSPPPQDTPTAWVILRRPGEDTDSGDRARLSLLEWLPQLPEEASAVELTRGEPSLSGLRAAPVVRAWRAGRLQGFVNGEPVVRGRALRATQMALTLDQARADGVRGAAERDESRQDWMTAARRWELLFEGDGPWAAYARMRAALCHEKLQPGATHIRRLLAEAWGMEPGLPEAGLRLAGWWLTGGNLENGISTAAMADAGGRRLAALPQLEGAGSWMVPAHLALWFARRAPALAVPYAEQALARHVPPKLAQQLTEIANAGGAEAQERV